MDILFPESCSCSVCGKLLKNYDKYYLCDHCKMNLSFLEKPCISFNEAYDKAIYTAEDTEHLESVISVCLYEGASREMVHKLKYNGKIEISLTMAAYMSEKLQESGVMYDLIVPVPSHSKRIKKRGYNQAALIAERLSDIMDIPCRELLCKIKDTESQVLLNGKNRWYNVKDAFDFDKSILKTGIRGLRILLVDDIITTGATVYYCSNELKKNGASIVTAVSFARTY